MFVGPFVVLLCFLATSTATHHQHEYYGVGGRKLKIDDKHFIQRQQDIYKLFDYVQQAPVYREHIELANSYSLENNLDAYVNASAVKHFLHYYKEGYYLKRDEVFSVYYDYHLREAIALFNVFYYARDYDTFYKTAVWARKHINEGVFVYAFSVALVHRPDTYGYFVPPVYEILPHYFFNSDVIQKAQSYKQQHWQHTKSPYTVYANYSGYYLNLSPEQRTFSYYLEDVGVNAFYYYVHIHYPFWMNGEEYHLKNDRRGELFYYVYRQILARYYLERLSHGYGEIDFFSYHDAYHQGYYPSLRYPNGLEFPARPHYAKLSDYFYNYGQDWTFKGHYGYSYTLAQDVERRIRDAIDRGYAYSRDGKFVDLFHGNGFEVLSNLIISNADSVNPRYYGNLEQYGRHLLSYSPQPLSPHKTAPSALEHYETAQRDPAFYSFYKRLTVLFEKYKSYYPPYTYNELYATGVKIDKFDVDKLVTYYDYFDADLTNAVYVHDDLTEETRPHIYARQYRLNHKPFSYRLHVNVETEGDYVVRLYFGPKTNEYGHKIPLEENRFNFVLFEEYHYHFQTGKNTVERNSRQFRWYVPDRIGRRELYNRFKSGGGDALNLDASEASYGYPNRFLLPKGTRGGRLYQFYVLITPYKAATGHPQKNESHGDGFYRVGSGYNYVDSHSYGFPFDRPVHSYEFHVPNSVFYDAYVYHRSGDELNSSHYVEGH